MDSVNSEGGLVDSTVFHQKQVAVSSRIVMVQGGILHFTVACSTGASLMSLVPEVSLKHSFILYQFFCFGDVFACGTCLMSNEYLLRLQKH